MSLRGRRGLIIGLGWCVTLAAIARVVADGGDLGPTAQPAIVTAILVVAVGELVVVNQIGRQMAPITTAAGMGMVLTPAMSGSPPMSWGLCVLLLAAPMTVGGMLAALSGRPADVFDHVCRYLGLSCAAAIARWDVGDGSVLTIVSRPEVTTLVAAFWLIGVALVGVLVDLVLWTFGRVRTLHVPFLTLIRLDLARSGAIGAMMTNGGALIAVTTPIIGPIAIPLFIWPIAIALFGLRRAGRIEATQRQLVLALSRLTDETGHTAKGHAGRVARLAQTIGEELGLSPGDLQVLFDAGLLHDVGQVTLNEPIPDGATILAAPAEQAHVNRQTIFLARQAGASDEVVEAIIGSAAQYREVREFGAVLPITARILRVANAYDDLTQGRRTARGPALERIHLGLGYEYDPAVVDALTRVTERSARSPQLG
ncbi:metal-dependent phosphohydrolase [Nostocoides veronense]|uniref:Metal-dependent phosphohydrolase n=1 Tax=Nostocoides veronense TaxID=330836 RepID=A0ABP4Y3K9_9MICO